MRVSMQGDRASGPEGVRHLAHAHMRDPTGMHDTQLPTYALYGSRVQRPGATYSIDGLFGVGDRSEARAASAAAERVVGRCTSERRSRCHRPLAL